MKIRTYLCQLNLDNLRWSKTHTYSYTQNDIKYMTLKGKFVKLIATRQIAE